MTMAMTLFDEYFVITVISKGHAPNHAEPQLFKNFKEAVDYIPNVIDEIQNYYGPWDIEQIEIKNKTDTVRVCNLNKGYCSIFISSIKIRGG